MAFGSKNIGLVLLVACTGNNATHDSHPSPADAAADVALPATLEFRPSRIEFGKTRAFTHKSVVLFNSSALTLEPKVQFIGDPVFGLYSEGCKFSLPPQKGCELDLTFLPNEYGDFTGTLVATAPNHNVTATISGSSVVGGLIAGLIGHWTFEDQPGSIVSDISGFANPGTVVQGTTPDAPPTAAQTAASQSGFGIDLAGQNTWVRVGRSESIDSTGNSGTFTSAAWVKPRMWDQNERYKWVISRIETGTTFPHFGLGFDNGRPTIKVHYFPEPSDEPIPVGQWTHVAGTYDGITMSLYVDGTLKKTLDAGFPIAADVTNVVIGAAQEINAMARFFNGVIDDVRLYNIALTAEQVKQLAQRP